MISYRIGFSECEHERASNGQHVRRRLFSRSVPACQEQNSDQFGLPPRPLTSHLSRSPGAQEVPMQRWIAGDLAVFNISNGLAMLFASSTWWASVPGVPATGTLPASGTGSSRQAAQRLLRGGGKRRHFRPRGAIARRCHCDYRRRRPQNRGAEPIKGAQKIIRFLVGIGGQERRPRHRIVPMTINGSAGALFLYGRRGRPYPEHGDRRREDRRDLYRP